MGTCTSSGGYENPAFGAWGIGVTFQLTAALVLLLLGAGHHDGPWILPDGNTQQDKPNTGEYHIRFITKVFFDVTGVLHLAFALVTGSLAAFGYLVSSCFLCPMSAVTVINSLLLVGTTACGGYILTEVGNFQRTKLRMLREDLDEVKSTHYSELFAYHNQGMIMYVSVVSLAALVPYGAGLSYSAKATSGARATATLPCLTLVGMAGLLVLYITALPQVCAFGIIWFVGLVLLVIVLRCQQRCCYCAMGIVSGALFALAALFALVTLGVFGRFFTEARKYLMLWSIATVLGREKQFVESLDDSEYNWLKATLVSYGGVYSLVEAALCCSIFVLSLFVSIHMLYEAVLKKSRESEAGDNASNANNAAPDNKDDSNEPESSA